MMLGIMQLPTSVVFSVVLSGLVSAQGDVDWRTDVAAARRVAAEAGKPLLVVFRCLP
jgi:hypothetical protein